MSLELIWQLYDYHRWANRRLSDHVASLGDEMAGRDVGSQFSFSTIRRTLSHIYGADAIWLARWKGTSPTAVPGADIATLAALRERWDALDIEQHQFLDGLSPEDLHRPVDYKSTEGTPYRLILGLLLHHVANHATHHRSEVATMVTMLSGSPPETGMVTYELTRSGQLR